jgi:hypothetical protein
MIATNNDRLGTIELEPIETATLRERVLIEMFRMLLILCPRDEAMTVLLSVTAAVLTERPISPVSLDDFLAQFRASVESHIKRESVH